MVGGGLVLSSPLHANQVALELDTLGTAVQTGRWRTLDSVVLSGPSWYFGYVIPTGTICTAPDSADSFSFRQRARGWGGGVGGGSQPAGVLDNTPTPGHPPAHPPEVRS